MSGIRPIIDDAVAAVLAEHPKYFTPKGHEHARTVIVRKVMAAIRGDGVGDKPAGVTTDAPALPQSMTVEPTSREGRAFANLCLLAGAVSPFRTSDGKYILPPESATEAVFAFNDLPPKADWLFLTDHKQIGAWAEFFREKLPNAARRPITQRNADDQTGILMPWLWPPRNDGTTYKPDAAEAAA